MTPLVPGGEADSVGIDPRKPFYIALSLGNIDNLLHGDGEEFEGISLTPEPLIEQASETAIVHGTETYIFQCIPIKRVRRGKVIVSNISKPKGRTQ